jgi:hypothetical protein
VRFRAGPSSTKDQPACKPGSVWPAADAATMTAIRLGRRLPGASSNLPERLVRTDPETWLRTAPIRSCSRWGLPCRFRCRKRGALLPHRFTLAAGQTLRARGGLLFCGTVPGVAPAGRYPAPFVRGARTFLPAALSGSPFQDFGGAAVQPTDPHGMGTKPRDVKPLCCLCRFRRRGQRRDWRERSIGVRALMGGATDPRGFDQRAQRQQR